MTSIVEIEELGRRIRQLRSERRLTLKQVEQASGLSATHLSEIERGRTSPTIGALARVARALDRDVAFFIEREERPEVAHQLREQREPVVWDAGISAESLAPGIPGSTLYGYQLRLDATAAALRLRAQSSPAEVVVHLQSGRLAANAGEMTLALAAGDTLRSALAEDLALRADGTAVECLVVSTRALEELR